MAPPPSQLNTLTAEAHRLYALLVPQSQGKIQVIVPENERAKLEARYKDVCAQLAALQAEQKKSRAAADEWVKEAQEAIPAMLPMLPPQWRPRMETLFAMAPGEARDKEMKAVLTELVNGEAIKRMGPLGLMVGPMLKKFLKAK